MQILRMKYIDLFLAKRREASSCPIAQCLMRHGYTGVLVGDDTITYTTPDGEECVEVDTHAVEANYFIDEWDHRGRRPSQGRVDLIDLVLPNSLWEAEEYGLTERGDQDDWD